MQFYGLSPLNLDTHPTPSSKATGNGRDPIVADHDFSRKRRRLAAHIDDVVMDQVDSSSSCVQNYALTIAKMNHAMALERAVSNAGRPPKSSLSMARTGFGLTDYAGYALSEVFRVLLKICSVPVPTSPSSTTLLKDISASGWLNNISCSRHGI